MRHHVYRPRTRSTGRGSERSHSAGSRMSHHLPSLRIGALAGLLFVSVGLFALPALTPSAGAGSGGVGTGGPAHLVIQASSTSMVYGSAVPTITPSYSGFVDSDTDWSLTTPPVCTTTASSSSSV